MMSVSCEQARQALSASLDGEQTRVTEDITEAHLEACEHCQHWYATVTSLNRALNIQSLANTSPDSTPPTHPQERLSLDLLLKNNPERGFLPPEKRRKIFYIGTGARLALVVIAVVYMIWAGILLFGSHSSASTLVDAYDPLYARFVLEAAVTRFALGVGLLCVAWRPAAAPGVLPIFLALWAFGAGIATRDVVMGIVDPQVSIAGIWDPIWTLAIHLCAALTLCMVWVSRYQGKLPLLQSWKLLSAQPMNFSEIDAHRHSSLRPD